jgi:D-alanine transaminase
VIDAVKAQGIPFEERAFTVEEAYSAREAFITSASQTVLPVVTINGRPVGNGAPGLIATGLRRDYHRYAEISEWPFQRDFGHPLNPAKIDKIL